jgi:hypothetical protein
VKVLITGQTLDNGSSVVRVRGGGLADASVRMLRAGLIFGDRGASPSRRGAKRWTACGPLWAFGCVLTKVTGGGCSTAEPGVGSVVAVVKNEPD